MNVFDKLGIDPLAAQKSLRDIMGPVKEKPPTISDQLKEDAARRKAEKQYHLFLTLEELQILELSLRHQHLNSPLHVRISNAIDRYKKKKMK
jgi:hypothetical protein